MSEENKTAEMIVKNIPETIYLILTDEKEFNEDDEVMDFEKDFDHEYTYWAQGESNSSSDINYVLKSKYDQQQSANAELKKQNAELVEVLTTLTNSNLFANIVHLNARAGGKKELNEAWEKALKLLSKHTT